MDSELIMALYDDLVAALPELEGSDAFIRRTIVLQNDADEAGDYIAVWNYSKPLPVGFKVGK
jgi:hypothetical protein